MRKISKKTGLLLGVGALVVVVATFAYVSTSKSSADKPKPVNTINYGPPTEEEIEETKRFKQAQQNPKPTPDPQKTRSGKTVVTPVISYAGQYDALFEAGAYIPGVIEAGGTCTITFKNGGATVKKVTKGAEDATTTRCEVFSFPSRELSPKGTWTATLQYSSATSEGTSQPVTVEVK